MKITQTFEYDVKTVGGVAFDGKDVWFSDPGNNALACVDPKTGKVRKRLKGPQIGSGTAWDGEHLWQVGPDTIQCIDPKTEKVVRTIPQPEKGFLSGLAWDGESLWAGASESRKLYKLDPKTGKVLKVLNSDRFVTGITWIGSDLYHAIYPEEGKPTEIRKIDPDTGKVLEKVEVPFTISGMAFDGEQFWCGDCKTARLRTITMEPKKKGKK